MAVPTTRSSGGGSSSPAARRPHRGPVPHGGRMTTTNRIVSIETPRGLTAAHSIVTAVSTRPDAGVEQRWTARAVLEAMNRAERFYTQAPNGRRARVQRYTCPECRHEHIRTHLSDRA